MLSINGLMVFWLTAGHPQLLPVPIFAGHINQQHTMLHEKQLRVDMALSLTRLKTIDPQRGAIMADIRLTVREKPPKLDFRLPGAFENELGVVRPTVFFHVQPMY